MKRTLALILSLILILAAIPAMGEDKPDPIIGVWYARINPPDFPVSGYDGYTNFVIVVTCDADGSITSFELDYAGTDCTLSNATGPVAAGKWEKEGFCYYSSILGAGRQRAYLVRGMLYLCIIPGTWYGLRKMETLDVYSELLTEQTIQYKGW